jgi:hypothetical protein
MPPSVLKEDNRGGVEKPLDISSQHGWDARVVFKVAGLKPLSGQGIALHQCPHIFWDDANLLHLLNHYLSATRAVPFWTVKADWVGGIWESQRGHSRVDLLSRQW